jgi:hypothetical protein
VCDKFKSLKTVIQCRNLKQRQKNVVEQDRPQTIWRKRCACCITKATDSGVPRNFFGWREDLHQKLFLGGGGEKFNKFSWRQRAERTGTWGRQPLSQGFHSICKWMQLAFWLGCYEYIFHGTGDLVELCQNFEISGGGGGGQTPFGTLLATDIHSVCVIPIAVPQQPRLHKRASMLRCTYTFLFFTVKGSVQVLNTGLYPRSI